ncbi:hypothetical protein CAAN1_18S01090 [[Candida] anglica]|uniref:F-box domain-containing protein n=1 Tax=[Candida] anglica TaxID=148631 RepID=A0ABP0ELU0_9ASCO
MSGLLNCHGLPLSPLPSSILSEVFEHVNQYDLVNLSLVNSVFYELSSARLYKKITVILDADFPCQYRDSATSFVEDNGITNMDTSLIFDLAKLYQLHSTFTRNPALIRKVRYFVFDKCSPTGHEGDDLDITLSQFMDILESSNVSSLNLLHITFIDFISGIDKLTSFMKNDKIRKRLCKLFINKLGDLYTPIVPQGLTNLFLMLDERELMEIEEIDLNSESFEILNSIQHLTCSTKEHLGLDILRKLKLRFNDQSSKLKLKGFTAFHCHRDNEEIIREHQEDEQTQVQFPESMSYLENMSKNLCFNTISSKIDISYLSQLFLKIDCNADRVDACDCFPTFFDDLTKYSVGNGGLPNLERFQLELFPNLEWLRPHQILESILTPLGTFIKSLASLSRLSIDFSTLGFKMFDNGMGMSSLLLNKLNERLMQAFFLSFFITSPTESISSSYTISSPVTEGGDLSCIMANLKTLQLPDFLTSFIYYRPEFYESLLHTCPCWGCQLVLDRLKELFIPLVSEKDDGEQEDETDEGSLDDESTYYLLIGFILGKLQADREVCIPIKRDSYKFDNYPIYKGQSHTLHTQFHSDENCQCFGDHNIPDIDSLTTTYITHQIRPILNYLSKIFYNLDTLMIHGIFYKKTDEGRMVSIYDEDEYPASFLASRKTEDGGERRPKIPFGKYTKIF